MTFLFCVQIVYVAINHWIIDVDGRLRLTTVVCERLNNSRGETDIIKLSRA